MSFCKVIYKTRLTTRFFPVLAQMINQNYILIIKLINQCELVVRIADAMLSRILINNESLYVFNATTLTQKKFARTL
jgi:hypothetical protein